MYCGHLSVLDPFQVHLPRSSNTSCSRHRQMKEVSILTFDTDVEHGLLGEPRTRFSLVRAYDIFLL